MPPLESGHVSPAPEEDEAINEGITSDPENPEWGEEDFAQALPVVETDPELAAMYRAGKLTLPLHGRRERPRTRVTIRLDSDVIARQPLLRDRVRTHELGERRVPQHICRLLDALGRQEPSPARRQVDGPVVDPPGDALGEQAGQDAVHGRVRLAQDDRQLQRVGERHTSERVEQLFFGESHVTSVATGEPYAHSPDVTRNSPTVGACLHASSLRIRDGV